MMVNTATLKGNPDFGKALVGAWYELMGIMSSDSKESVAAKTEMAKASGTDLDGFNSQLKTTQMYYKPADAVAFTKDAKLAQTMTFVAKFLFDHGILGQNAPGPDFVGVAFPGGKTIGDKSNLKLRFDTTYMDMAADGKL
jgi:NitT/TauT family transport system substrate-binding protein